MDSFIVSFWNILFRLLSYLSLFKIITSVFKKLQTHLFVEIYVICNTTLAFLSIIFVTSCRPCIWHYFLLTYSMFRVLEILVYQINVLLFDELRAREQHKSYSIKSYRRMIILLLHNFVEIIFWFAAGYGLFLYNFNTPIQNMSLLRLIYSSFTVMTTFGTNILSAKTEFGFCMIWMQSICGLIMTVISLTRFIGLLPTVKSDDVNERIE